MLPPSSPLAHYFGGQASHRKKGTQCAVSAADVALFEPATRWLPEAGLSTEVMG